MRVCVFYRRSPSFNWKKKLDDGAIADFQRRLGEMGYKFQFGDGTKDRKDELVCRRAAHTGVSI